jgi:hypothetical protein
MIRRSHQPGQSRRQGVISMELILTLPILLMLLLGIFEFSFLMSARGDVVQASRAGCRLATLNGVVPEDVENEVVRTLGSPMQSACSVQSQLGVNSGDEVLVTVRVPMAAVAPNLLWPLGYNLQGRDLISQTRMLKE